MKRDGYCPYRHNYKKTEPFPDVLTAWFWFCRCLLAKEDGARGVGDSESLAPPCEMADIYRIVRRLLAENILKLCQVKVMTRFGKEQMPPDVRFGARELDVRFWVDGMKALEGEFIRKGIVVALVANREGVTDGK